MEPEIIRNFDSDSKLKSDSGHAILLRWREIVSRHGDDAAVFSPSGEVLRRFHEVDSQAATFAQSFFADGADVVSMHAVNSAEWIDCLLAIWMAGGIPLLTDSFMNPSAREAAERQCGASIRVTGNCDSAVSTGFDPVALGPLRPALIKLTSGTTSTPRAVFFTSEQLVADCDAICEGMAIRSEDINYGVIAFSHSYGFSNLVTPLLCHGIPLVAATDALPHAILSGVNQSAATILPAVPAIFQALSGINAKMESVRLCISAGAPLRVAVADEFRACFGRKLHSFYGATECGGICFDTTPDPISIEGWVGTPLPGVRLEPVRVSDAGTQFTVHSPAAGLGYFPVADSALPGSGAYLPADWLEGNPVDGFCLVGRDSDWINVAGRKLIPGEVESVLREIPGVRDALVLGVDDPRRGQRVCAIVVTRPEVSAAEIQNHCRRNLSPWQIPREMVFMDSLPVNERGKTSRRDLAERWSSFFAGS